MDPNSELLYCLQETVDPHSPRRNDEDKLKKIKRMIQQSYQISTQKIFVRELMYLAQKRIVIDLKTLR